MAKVVLAKRTEYAKVDALGKILKTYWHIWYILCLIRKQDTLAYFACWTMQLPH